MTRAELDAALSVARETAYREAADDAHAHAEDYRRRPNTRKALLAHAERCLNEADDESAHRMGRAPLSSGYPELHRQHWPRVLAAADDAVAGRLTHGCDARPLEHWGGPHVDRASIARMLRDGMREATCPGYANSFLTRGAP